MSEDEVERRLRDAFAAQAFTSVPDHAPAPAWQPGRPASQQVKRWRVGRVLAPIAVAAAVAAIAVGVAVSIDHGSGGRHAVAGASHSPSSFPSTVVAQKPVGLTFALADDAHVGVGMPVVAYFTSRITDGRELQHATSVRVNGTPVQADWYFTPVTDKPGYAMQGHLRMRQYWPAHATISVTVPVAGLSAGPGMAYADDAALTFSTGAATIATVDDVTHRMKVVEDGKSVGIFPVSLGAPATPTSSGVKVVMAKGASLCMKGPGYDVCNIKYTQRLTVTGEYLHAAPWNVKNIDDGVDSSNGCTNLTTADAKRLYGMLEIGDVVRYPDADGPAMTLAEGLGDWNVSWRTWLTGGAAPTN